MRTLLFSFLFICAAPFMTIAQADTIMDPIQPPKKAVPIVLPDSNGQPFDMAEYKGKYILVNFWAHWCGPCVKEFPAMQTLYDALKEDNFTILAVHAGPPQGRVRPFLEKKNITFKSVLDANMSAKGWDVRALPMSYLVSPDGYLIYKALGPREWEVDKMKALIQQHRENSQ
ncbi:MAG TPA: hypothetical protein DCR13_04880 [Gammaproteobacteria bacterium]|nr:hypothetical protein [Gammaproteobacteria bacterium]